ncbi:hypothetical protein BAU15_03950 [Enterococcus sp. JM4C]|nr:hypothetical protein BAU15_03950 [Enterococcus sp. JM4C]
MLIKEGELSEVDVRYIGKTGVAFDSGKIYKAVAYLPDENLISVTDESNEDYLYMPKSFELLGDIEKLPHYKD